MTPDLNRSIAGILPEILRHWRIHLSLSDDLCRYDRLAKKLQVIFPESYDNVILLIVDGLGVHNLQPGIIQENLEENGLIATSTFPTITATAMTSLIYGKHPSQHGIAGNNLYHIKSGKIVNILRMSYVGPDGMMPFLDNYPLTDLVDGPSLSTVIYDKIGDDFTSFIPSYLKPPGLGDLLHPAVKSVTYDDYQDLLSQVNLRLNKTSPQFMMLYTPALDSAGHKSGPFSDEYIDELYKVEQLIESIQQHQKLSEANTLFVLTSDHGQVDVHPEVAISQQQLDTYKAQNIILTASGRVIHGYALDKNTDDVKSILKQMKDQSAILLTKQEAKQLMGNNSKLDLLGDYLLVTISEKMISVADPLTGKTGNNRGHHGSVTKTEIEIPIVFLNP